MLSRAATYVFLKVPLGSIRSRSWPSAASPPPNLQPKEFAFTAENPAWAKRQIAKYPEGRQASAVIPLLWRAQEQAGGWLPQKAIAYVADLLGMAHIRVLEVATFYTMFNLEPVGEFHVQLCGTTPCMLRGADELIKVCHDRIGEQLHVIGRRRLLLGRGRVPRRLRECADGADQLRLLRGPDARELRQACSTSSRRASRSKPGPQVDRQFSAPVGGPTTLTDPSSTRTATAANAQSRR